jgi:hypothetical protein
MVLANIIAAANVATNTNESSVIVGASIVLCIVTFTLLLWNRGSKTHA